MPLALASRATQTNSAMFRTIMTIGIARNVLHIAQPAIPEAVSDCRAKAGRTKTLSVAIEYGTRFDLICMPVVKRYHSELSGCNLECSKNNTDKKVCATGA